MEITLKVSSIVLILIGCIHTGFSFGQFSQPSEDALWFISGGLLFIFSGMFNLFVLSNRKVSLNRTYYLKIVNLLLAVFLVFMVIQLPMVPGFVGLGCSIILLISNNST